MEAADYLINFAVAVACIGIALGLVASSCQPMKPTIDLRALHDAISAVAFKPSSKLIVHLYIPEGVELRASGSTIRVDGASIPIGFIALANRSTWIVSGVDEHSISYRVGFNDLELSGGLTYTLSVECVRPDRIEIRVLGYR